MGEQKVVKRSFAIALGIICIILTVGLVGASAYCESMINTKSSQDSQTTLQSWTEGNFSFSLDPGNNMSYTISTGGFRSLSITIAAYFYPMDQAEAAFQVFVGFIVANATVRYQVCDVLPKPVFPASFLPPGFPPWFPYLRKAISFAQTFEVDSSEVMFWIWNNSTFPIWGTLLYYIAK
jgi:hypothetical protein